MYGLYAVQTDIVRLTVAFRFTCISYSLIHFLVMLHVYALRVIYWCTFDFICEKQCCISQS